MASRENDEGRSMGGESSRSDSANSGNSQGGSRGRSGRGFASMDRSKQKEIASKGGRAAHAKGTAHEFDTNEAREAGRKGGIAVSKNREHMAAIGRRGGEARGQSRARSGNGENGQSARGNVSDREVSLGHGADSAQNSGGMGGQQRSNTADQSSRDERFGNS